MNIGRQYVARLNHSLMLFDMACAGLEVETAGQLLEAFDGIWKHDGFAGSRDPYELGYLVIFVSVLQPVK